MKTFRILVIVIVLLGAGYAIWRFMGAGSAATTEKAAEAKPAAAPAAVAAVKPGGIEAPKMPAKVAAPTAAPAAVKADAATAVVASATDLSNPQPQADLNACIEQSIKLLEAKDILNLLKTLMPPDAFQQESANGRGFTYEDMAAQFSQQPNFVEKMTQLQQALESVKGLTPELNADGTEATFKIDPAIGGPASGGEMRFTRQAGNWYLK